MCVADLLALFRGPPVETMGKKENSRMKAFASQ
jgi:hypothetical protein